MTAQEQEFLSLLAELAYFRRDKFRLLGAGADKDNRFSLAAWKEGDKEPHPASPLAPYLSRLASGEDAFLLAGEALSAAETAQGKAVIPPPEDEADFNRVVPFLRVLVMPVKGHEELLARHIHLRELDLALVPYIRRSETELNFFLTRARYEWHLSRDEFMRAAFRNMRKKFPVFIAPLGNAEAAPGSWMWDPEMMYWVKAGKPGEPYGAAGVFYPSVLETISERLDGNLYVLPTSVHRMLVGRAPDEDEYGAAEYRQYLRDFLWKANREIPERMVLSDRLYFYERGYGIRPV